jgi:hypothetical protein
VGHGPETCREVRDPREDIGGLDLMTGMGAFCTEAMMKVLKELFLRRLIKSTGKTTIID